jgi:6-phosphogluconate dehydrogenase
MKMDRLSLKKSETLQARRELVNTPLRTGKWTAISALDLGTPVTLIGEAVFARCLSALKDERVAASKILQGPIGVHFPGDKKAFVEDIRNAVYAAKIISYAQGFMELREAAKEHGWNLNYGGIALMWRGGCIIRRYSSLTQVHHSF